MNGLRRSLVVVISQEIVQGLALNGRFEQGDFQNQLPIAVKGSINKNGDVFSVGNMKEKIQITEKLVFHL